MNQTNTSVSRNRAMRELTIRELSSRNTWEYENGFYWFGHPTRVAKLLAHYDLYSMIVGLPGHILELGVYKAASMVRWASFRSLLENDFARKIVGFDAFGKFPSSGVAAPDDADFVARFEGAGGDGLSFSEAESIFEWKGFRNIELVAGDVFDTLPTYLRCNPECRIALLHLDMDVEKPTEFALDQLYDRVVPGGLVVIDDYNAVAGATRATEAFCTARGLKLQVTRHYSVPAFVQKPG